MINEKREEKFKRLANSRTNAALQKLRLIANLANKSNYEWTEEEAKKIISVLEEQMRVVKSKFTSKPKRNFEL